ncbi:hypothetical protein [Sphingobium sp. LF-16]|uniref:hypothetical protein n=1 Tax=Sphingobium sp. LF-16 TaxID=2185111 RepID=UPI0013DDF60B|nr:hypothetical protein [Sphingobium sp. LF-16]
MKAIQLHTAERDNEGVRQEAGEILVVGNGKKQIDADRAKTLVDNGGAVIAPDATK